VKKGGSANVSSSGGKKNMKTANGTNGRKRTQVPAVVEPVLLHEVLCRVVRPVGDAVFAATLDSGESRSICGDHTASRLDMYTLGLLVEGILREFGREGIPAPSLETEEAVLLPPGGAPSFRLVADPFDGTKAGDNFKARHDLPLTNPTSAISVAAVCPCSGKILASAVYALDLREVFSAWRVRDGGPPSGCIAFRNDTVLQPIGPMVNPVITAKKRVLHANYAAGDLARLAAVDEALVHAGLAPSYGGLAGSSAIDVINVIRGSFCGYVDVRAIVGVSGARLKFYDIAGVILPAMARGLSVRLMTGSGELVANEHLRHDTPVGLIVARPEALDPILDALAASAFPSIRSALAESVAPEPPWLPMLQ
jgi:fructose-1,6-bisphosphatase/inositol monophosphatase family enzyme